jgi:hypothetical protein
MFSVMWSEHCSYKSSKPLLKTLPTRGNGMMAGVGDNAGVVRSATGWRWRSRSRATTTRPRWSRTRAPRPASAASCATSSPWARGPIAVLDALRFGDPADPRTRHLVDGIVRGVGGYGNCVGVPTVGGELVFDPSYQGNPLVNVMAIGLLEERMLILAEAPGTGQLRGPVRLHDRPRRHRRRSVLASATFQDQDPEQAAGGPGRRPVRGEAADRGQPRADRPPARRRHPGPGRRRHQLRHSESADKAGTGILLDLDAIPRREPGMAPWEVMISESQERMLATCLPENYPAVREVCERWGIPIALVGRVTTDGDIAIIEGGIGPTALPNPGAKEIARIPAKALTSEAIVHYRLATPPTRRRQAPAPGIPLTAQDGLPERGMDPAAVLVALLGSPTSRAAAGSTSSTTRRPEQHRRVARPRRRGAAGQGHEEGARGHDGRQSDRQRHRPAPGRAALRGRGHAQRQHHRRPAARHHQLPQLRQPGAPRGVLAAAGSGPGHGRGLPRARLPVTGGNVSLYNEYPGGAIAPTPEIGVVGLLEDISLLVRPPFTTEGDASSCRAEHVPGMAGSAYAPWPGISSEDSPPSLDLDREAALQSFIREAIGRGLVASAQDVSGGGLAVAIAECCMWSGLGASSGSVSRVRRRSSCSARARRGSCCRAAAPRPGARVAGPPVRAAPPRPRHRRRRPAAHRADRPGRDRRGRGARLSRRRRPGRLLADLRHTWDHGLARALGVEHGPDYGSEAAETAGRRRVRRRPLAMCGIFGAVTPGMDAAGSPRSASSRSSTAARNRPGLAVSDGEQLMLYKDLGLIAQVLDERRLPSLRGSPGHLPLPLLHDRIDVWENAQPTFRMGRGRAIAIGHNGNLVNTRELLARLEGGKSRLRPRRTRSC